MVKNELHVLKKTSNKKYEKLKIFLFPYYPLKFFSSIQLITFFAFLMALHIILVYVGFNIPIVNVSFNFDWISTYLVGWFYGPIIGALFGFIANNISWLQTGGTFWYWLYSIQEPLIAIFSSFISFYFYLTKYKQNIKLTIFIQQLFIFGFFILSITVIVLYYLKNINDDKETINELGNKNLLISILIIFSLFLIFVEFFLIYKIKKKKRLFDIKIFLCSTIIIISMLFLFGLATGPIINADYLYYFFKIGTTKMNYLTQYFTQAVVLFIHVPFSILLLYESLNITIKSFDRVKQSYFYKKQL